MCPAHLLSSYTQEEQEVFSIGMHVRELFADWSAWCGMEINLSDIPAIFGSFSSLGHILAYLNWDILAYSQRKAQSFGRCISVQLQCCYPVEVQNMMWGTTPVLLAGDTWCSDTAALFAGLCHCPTHCWMAPLLSPPWFSFMGSLEASPISSLWPSSWWYRLSARWVTMHLLGISRTF